MERLRTFIAVGLDDALRDRAIGLQEKLAATGAQVKWVEPENLHVTLLFLGEVGERDLVDVCRAVTEACSRQSRFSLSLEGVGCFPNARRPRVIWAGIGEGGQELCDLHDSLEQPLLELGCYRREERHFTPHITLGRVKNEGTNDELVKSLEKLHKWKGGVMQAREVLVMSSELTPKGPAYAVMSRGRFTSE
ncbi:MAG: RNA 2',3'-cyclic phosphodiesterase [Gemmataceae bacterium]